MLTWNEQKDLSEENVVRATSYEEVPYWKDNEFPECNYYSVDSFCTANGTIKWEAYASFFIGEKKTHQKVGSLEEGKALCESWCREFWRELEQIVKQHQN